MKKPFLTVLFCIMISCFVPHASLPVSYADEEGWKLIHKDASGNATYVDETALSRPSHDTVTVKMKYVGNKGKTVMYFYNEIDCSRNMIKRLSMNLHNPSCLGEGEAVYEKSFEGRWDVLSEGLEDRLRDAVCGEKAREVKKHSE